MATTAVIYKSRYGSSKQYAKWIAAALDADLIELNSKTPARLFAPYETIIYGGALYGGRIAGFPRFKKIFTSYSGKRFILFTVGLTSTDTPGVFAPIIDKAFTSEMHARVKVFHLRGDIDYKRLSFVHRAMMAMLVKLISKKPAEALTSDEKGLVSSYGKSVSFVDEAALEPILKYVSSLDEAVGF